MMLVGEQVDVRESFARRALLALANAGVTSEAAEEIAAAAGLAAVENGWEVSELHFHLARLLEALGLVEVAGRLLGQALPAGAVANGTTLRISPGLYPLLRAGALRQTGDGAWRLDAGALAGDGGGLELSYARLMSFFAGELIGLWRESDGRGRLELAGWGRHARSFARGRGETERRCREWRRDLAEALGRRARDLGLAGAPDVVFAEPV